eukprot:4750322-Pleurochrysis_carterae.AAC.1
MITADAPASAASADSAVQVVPVFDHTPSRLELLCDADDLALIRSTFPLHADLIINTLLSFDSLLADLCGFA